MAYELTWYQPNSTLLLTITGHYTFTEALEVNEKVMGYLDTCKEPITLLIDSTQMNRPHNFDEIRSAQSFMNHLQLKSIKIVSDDRLIKLSMMVIFNLGRAPFNLYDNMGIAKQMIQYQR